jgi:hypothetical protein
MFKLDNIATITSPSIHFNDRIILDNYIWPDVLIKVSFYIYLTLITQLAKKKKK